MSHAGLLKAVKEPAGPPPLLLRERAAGPKLPIGPKMPLGQHQWDHILVGIGEFTTHFRTDFSGWIGMFTGGTIWVLTQSQMASVFLPNHWKKGWWPRKTHPFQ